MEVTPFKIEANITENEDSLDIEHPTEFIAIDVKQEFSCSPKKEYEDNSSEYNNDMDVLTLKYDATDKSKVKLEENNHFFIESELGCTDQVAVYNNNETVAKNEEIDISDETVVDVKDNIQQEDSNNKDQTKLHHATACLTRHLSSHSYKFKCQFCSKSFCRKLHLDSHLLNNHKHTIFALEKDLARDFKCKIYSCNECKYETVIPPHLARHMKSHGTKRKNKENDLCSDKTEYKADCKNRKPCACPSPWCDKGFSRKAYLDKHILKYHDNEEDLLKIISTKSLLDASLSSQHSKTFECEFCPKSYRRKLHLDSHVFCNHKHTIIALGKDFTRDFKCKLYSCDVCVYQTVIPTNLMRHMKLLHGEKPTDKVKDLSCDKCGYKTGGKARLREHLFTHSDVKPCICPSPSCDNKGFIRKVYLDTHILKCHKEDEELLKIISSKRYTSERSARTGLPF